MPGCIYLELSRATNYSMTERGTTMLKVLITLSLLATYSVPAAANDVQFMSATQAEGTPRKEELSLMDTRFEYPITKALGWGLLPPGFESLSGEHIEFVWPRAHKDASFNNFVIAG